MAAWAERPGGTAFLRSHGVDAVEIAAAEAGFPLWLVDVPGSSPTAIEHILSADERARADRFRTAELRRRYAAAHAALRLLGEWYFGIAAAGQVYVANAFGKPRLTDHAHLNCSISYGADKALIAWHQGAEIGVDLEPLRPIPDALELMQAHYTPSEQAGLSLLRTNPDSLCESFLSVWVRKEACVKALGRGLDVPLTDLECGFETHPALVQAPGGKIRTGLLRIFPRHLAAWAECLP